MGGSQGKPEEIEREGSGRERKQRELQIVLEKAVVARIIINVITEAAVLRSVATRNGQLVCILNECVRLV